MSDWVRALGIDYGTARIGIAVSDDLGFLAHPLETVAGGDSEKAAARIAELVRLRRIEHLVVGLPLHRNGEEGAAVGRVRAFVALLRPHLSEGITVHEVDEHRTTVSAMEKLHAAGRNAKNSKGIIDKAAAVEILQIWLDQRAGEGLQPNGGE
jgi:putative Holliday junction resolvase